MGKHTAHEGRCEAAGLMIIFLLRIRSRELADSRQEDQTCGC